MGRLLAGKSTGRRPRLPPPVRLVAGLATLVLLGTLLLLLPGVSVGQRLALNEALFTATSALSVTGLSLIVPALDLTLLGQVILLALIQVGGVGFMVVAVIALRLLGRRVSLADRLALTDSLGLDVPRAILRLTGRGLLAVLAIEALGTVALWLHWRPMLGDGRALFYGLFHAVSAFCNAGFELFTGLPGYNGIPSDPLTLAIMGTLIVIGGLGIPVVGDLLFRRDHLSLHSRITLVISLVLIVVGGVGIYLAENRPAGTLTDASVLEGLRLAFFQSVSTRTAGFSGLPDFAQLNPGSQWLMTMLMFVGSAPASMGGGITTGTLAVLTLSFWGYVRGEAAAQVGGRRIAAEAVRRASVVLTISVFAVATATWLLLMSHRGSIADALFTAVSAFATTGLSLPFTDQLNGFGQLIIMGMMFWGRLGALTIVVALARPRTPQPVTYPEEPLLIG